jgi:hypothetical protein
LTITRTPADVKATADPPLVSATENVDSVTGIAKYSTPATSGAGKDPPASARNDTASFKAKPCTSRVNVLETVDTAAANLPGFGNAPRGRPNRYRSAAEQ